MYKQKQVGFTLPEMAITLGILGILTAMALPSFTGMLERRRLVSAAEAIESDLRWARGEAIKRNDNIKLTFTNGPPWAYEINTSADPVVLPIVCPPPATSLKAVCGNAINEFNGITLTQNFVGNDTTFNPVRGTADTGTITVTSGNGNALNIVISILGRARICSVGGTIGGYDAC